MWGVVFTDDVLLSYQQTSDENLGFADGNTKQQWEGQKDHSSVYPSFEVMFFYVANSISPSFCYDQLWPFCSIFNWILFLHILSP